MLTPDRWNDRYPKAAETTVAELIDLLSVAAKADDTLFTDWDRSFCHSLATQLRKGWRVSERQEAVLDKGLLRRLWSNDPDLWADPLPPEPRAHVLPLPSLKHRWRAVRRAIDHARFWHHPDAEVARLRHVLREIEAQLDTTSMCPPPF